MGSGVASLTGTSGVVTSGAIATGAVSGTAASAVTAGAGACESRRRGVCGSVWWPEVVTERSSH